MYEEILDDPKLDRLSDLAFRCLFLAMAFCSRTPDWKKRREGWLYHSEGFPVDSRDFYRRVAPETHQKPTTISDVENALDSLCSVGGERSLMAKDGDSGAFRLRRWRKWQDGLVAEFRRETAENTPEPNQEPAKNPPHIDYRQETLDVRQNGSCEEHPSQVPPKKKRKAPQYTLEENAWKADRLKHWDLCLKHYYNGQSVEFTEGPHAAKFFVQMARKGKQDGALVDKAISSYFREKADSRKWQRERAAKTGEEPKAVAVRFSEFVSKFDDQMAKVLERMGEDNAVR